MVYERQGFLEGVFILTAAGFFSRFLGFFYRILLPRLIGAEAVGLYQYVYPIYTTILVVSMSGIPIAISKLVAEKIASHQKASAFRIFILARRMSIVLGAFFALLLLLLARPLSSYLDPMIFYALLAITPAIFIVSIMATYRGFFQGMQTMLPTAFSQAIEQLIRMATILALSYLLLPYGIEWAAAGATFGAVTGSLGGLALLLYIYWKKRKEIAVFRLKDAIESMPSKEVYQRILKLALPVTFGALVLPLMEFVDVMIVPRRLQYIGFDLSRSRELFAMLTGMAMVLVHFPTLFTISLSAGLVPSISQYYAKGELEQIRVRAMTSFRMAILITLPAAAGLFLLAKPISTVIFGEPGAAVPLEIVCWGIIFIGFQQVTSAILQGMGMVREPAKNLLFGALLNGVLNYTLTGLPQLGIRGASIGTVSGFFVAGLLNLVYLQRRISLKAFAKEIVFLPVAATLAMALYIHLSFSPLLALSHRLTLLFYSLIKREALSSYVDFLSLVFVTAFVIFSACLVYLGAIVLLGAVREEELLLIPKVGDLLAGIRRKVKLKSGL